MIRMLLNSQSSPNGDIITLVGVKQISIIALALQDCFEIIQPRISRCSDSQQRRSDNGCPHRGRKPDC